MAIVRAEFNDTGGGATLLAAQPGRIIRVERLLLHSVQSGSLRLTADPAGTPTDLTPRLYLASQGRVWLPLAPPFALDVPRGQALGLTAEFTFTNSYGVMLWYELVA